MKTIYLYIIYRKQFNQAIHPSLGMPKILHLMVHSELKVVVIDTNLNFILRIIILNYIIADYYHIGFLNFTDYYYQSYLKTFRMKTF